VVSKTVYFIFNRFWNPIPSWK